MNPVWTEKQNTGKTGRQISRRDLVSFLAIVVFLCLMNLADRTEAQITHQDTTNVPGISIENKQVRVLKPQHRSPMGAMMRSALFPGWGQVYTGHYVKAGLIFALESGLIISAINEDKEAKDVYATDYEAYLDRIDRRNSFIWWTAGVIVYSMVDAYVDAHLFHFDEDEVSLGLESGASTGDVRLVLRIPMPDFR